MRLTAYNLIMSLVWSSLCIVIFCLLRRNYNFIQKYGVFPLIAVLLLGLFRFFVPIELPYTRLIQSYDILPGIQQWSRRSSGLFSLSYGALLLGLWAAVSTILRQGFFSALPCSGGPSPNSPVWTARMRSEPWKSCSPEQNTGENIR